MTMRLQKNRFTIYPKLLLGFLIAILPVYMLGIFLNHQVANSLREQILQSMQSNVKFYLSSLENEISKIDKFKRSLVVDEDLMTLGTIAPALSDNELRESILRLERKLTLLKDSSSYIAEVSFHIPLINKKIKPGTYEDGVPLDSLNQFRTKMQQQLSPLLWWDNKLLLSSYYPESAFSNRVPVFLIEIEIDQNMILKDLRNMVDQGEAIIFFNKDNKYISNNRLGDVSDEIHSLLTQKNSSSNDRAIIENNGKRYLVSLQRSPIYDFTLAIYTPESVIMRDFDKFNILFWVLFVLSILVIVMFSYWIFITIRNPLRNMLIAFRKVEQGDLSIRISQVSNDEFLDLSDQFNKMVNQLQSLIQEVYEQQIRTQQSELKQLQSQINPHFLYNSFFILHQLIEFEDMDNARKFVGYLGDYFQFITRDAKSELRLSQEVKHSEAYVNIQSMRFGDRIRVNFEPIPEQYGLVHVPRLILQPIIENAFEYGLETKPSEGVLHITNFVRDHLLYIRFEDNGTLLTEEKLEHLSDMFRMNSVGMEITGILNVHRRLQIKFGRSAGLEVYRSDLGGLGVLMKIPLMEEDET